MEEDVPVATEAIRTEFAELKMRQSSKKGKREAFGIPRCIIITIQAINYPKDSLKGGENASRLSCLI